MTTRNKILLWGGLAILVVAAVTAAAVFLVLRTLTNPNEATARYVPARTAVYITINLRPGFGQLRKARNVMQRLLTDDVLDRRDDLLDDWEDETDIHFLDDVSAWLGSDISLVIPSFDLYQPKWVLLAQVRDRPATEDFIEDFVNYFEEKRNTDYDRDRGGSVDLWVADDEILAMGLTDDYLLIGDSQDAIEQMVDNIESPPSRPLSERASYVAAQDALPADRFMFLHVDAERAMDALEDGFDPYDDVPEAFRRARNNIPEYVAASASFIDDGIRIDLVGEPPSGAYAFRSENPLTSPGTLPADTLALLSMGGVERVWAETSKALDAANLYAWEDFEDDLEDIRDDVGVDLERDLIREMRGEAALALLPGVFNFQAYDSDEFGVIEALLLVGVEDSTAILDPLEVFADFLEDEGFHIHRGSLGGYDLVTLSPDDYGIQGFEPGYIATDDWTVVGTNIEGLRAFHDAATGEVETLASNPRFKRIIGLAPEPIHILLYADMVGILEMVEEGLDRETRSEYRSDVEPFLENLGGVLMAGSMTEEEIRVTMIMTLRD